MKKIAGLITFLILASITSPLSAQNRITITLDDFSSLNVSGGIDLELIPSESREMSITSRNGQPEEVGVEIKNDELRIRIRPRIDKDDIIKIKLPYKNLTKIEASAGAVINSARDITAGELELVALSGGKIELSLQVNSLDAKVIQVSDIVLYGKAVSQNVVANTGGNYLAYDLECQDSYIKSSSGAQAKVTASRIIEATAGSKGYIGYIGEPVSSYTKTSLGGEIASFRKKPENDDY